MRLTRRGVLLLAARTLLLLPLCLVAWYFAAGVFAWIPGRVAAPVIGAVAGAQVTMALKERALRYTAALEMPYRPGVRPVRVAAGVEIDSAKYTYGIALFAALALAVRGWTRPVGLAIGAAILVVLPIVGIASEALKQLGSVAGLAPFLAWGGGTREAIALGYQVGTLLLPTLAPVVLWLVLFPQAWRETPSAKFAGRESVG